MISEILEINLTRLLDVNNDDKQEPPVMMTETKYSVLLYSINVKKYI